MSRSKYKEGESVLCYQGLLIYEAKIQGVRKEQGVFEYDIHYQGWKRSWDEWVTEERLLKNNPENVKKQKEVEAEVKAKGKSAAKKTGGIAPAPRRVEPEPDKRRQKEGGGEERDVKKQKTGDYLTKMMEGSARSRSNSDASIISIKSTGSTKDESTKSKRTDKRGKEIQNKKGGKKPEPAPLPVQAKPRILTRRVPFGSCVRIDIPESLKTVLVDDFDYIIRQRKLLSIPSRYTVEDLINAYYQSKRDEEGSSHKLAAVQEICRGLKDYFSSTLGSQLLYKFERIQYMDILKENTNVPMYQLYGPVHLLRLVTKLGPMLTAANIDKHSLNILVMHLKEFIDYVGRHKQTLFQVEDYGTASPEYHRRAM